MKVENELVYNKNSSIRECRKKSGLRPIDVVKELGLKHYRTYWRYEKGLRVPSITTLMKMSRLFGVTLGTLVGMDEPNIVKEPVPMHICPKCKEKLVATNVEVSPGIFVKVWTCGCRNGCPADES